MYTCIDMICIDYSPTSHTQYNIPLHCSPHYVFSAANDLHFLHPTKRNAILQTKSFRLQHKTKASTLLCTFLFFPPTKKKGKEKMGQQQLNSQISGFVKAEEVCSWGSKGGKGGRPLFFSQTNKQRLPTLFCIFLHLSSLKMQIKTM